MCYYEIMGELTQYIEEKISKGLDDFINKYDGKDNYFLIYPLINIELGAMQEPPENINNLFNRCITGFLYDNIKRKNMQLNSKTINVASFEKFKTKIKPELIKIFEDYRFKREIKVGNTITHAILEEKGENRYQLITSLVTDKYKEESFYFYGFDDKEKFKQEEELVHSGYMRFGYKYLVGGYEDFIGNRMEESIDYELYEYCKSLIRKDLSKWEGKVKSNIFNNIEELCGVLGFLYYLAFLRKMRSKILYELNGIDKSVCDMLLMKYDKQWLISKISVVSGYNKNIVNRILSYFINQGCANILEFPLFQIDNDIITAPSLIIVNDWQFTIINGHKIKSGVEIKNRQKTISAVTEKRINNMLENIGNILVAKEKYYEFYNDDKIKINSDIDYAIYDLEHNILLVIEAKWKDNHYYDEIDESYVKIENTVNEIFKVQFDKHKRYLNIPGNIEHLFNNDERLKSVKQTPNIYWLAVDKRSQYHKDDYHMISEFMLLYFLNLCIKEEGIDLRILVDEVSSLQTKVEYIQCDDEFKVFKLKNKKTILIEKHELSLDYRF